MISALSLRRCLPIHLVMRKDADTAASLTAIAPTWFWAAVAGVLGLSFGSFFTVLAYRWPREESIVTPRSRCTSCGHTLRWYENLPLLSWLALGRRCASCREPISWRYPAIEAVTGLLAAGAIAVFGPTWRGLAVMVMLVALVPVVVIDLEHKLIPDLVVYPAFALALGAMILHDTTRWWVPVAGAAGAAGFLGLLHLIKPKGMGLGDVKLALLLGAVLGGSVIPALFIAFLAGSLLGAVLIARFGRGAGKTQVPFGPYLALGAVLALWIGPTLISLYTDQIR